MEMKSKKLPYGISNYKTIALENYIYVDKTAYIEKLDNYHSPFIFFLRPRRFGKSLFTSVLQNYYDQNEKEHFEFLFQNTYIGEHPTSERNGYYILNFDFTGVATDTQEELEKSFANVTKFAFELFQSRYKIEMDLLKEGSAANIFEDFITKISTRIDKPLYVVIDEYDHFANELLSFKIDLFRQSVSNTGFVRKWYEVLKKATKTVVKRIFATGVSPITLDSLTSGFNIADNITRLETFNEMMGFTEAEVRDIVKNTAKFSVDEKKMDGLIEILKKNYNGYLFSERAEVRLFNSDMILYYLKTYVENREGPDDLVDENIASDYGKLGKMFELKNKNENMKVLDTILKEEETMAHITNQFSMEKEFTPDDFKSLLFYLGLLTIDKRMLSRVKLKVPNYAIKGLYYEYYVKKLREAVNYEIDVSEIQEAVEEIAIEGINDKFIKIIEKTLNRLSKRDFIKFDEKYIKMVMVAYSILSKVYMVKSEYEVEGGYIDLALLKRETITPAYFAIFEIKYIKKGDYAQYGNLLLEEKKKEAIGQINKYTGSKELKELTNLKKWIIVFAGEQCILNLTI